MSEMGAVFKRVGAPLRVPRQSWGSVRETDGTVFLRVWQEECRKIGGIMCALVYRSEGVSCFGRTERLQHIQLIKSGAPCLLVMCVAKDPKVHPKSIAKVNERELFVTTGEIVDDDGDLYVQMTMQRVKV